MPAVNLANHAGLGMIMQLLEARRYARPGDVVLLAFEYQFYIDTVYDYKDLFWGYVWTYDPALIFGLPPDKALSFIYLNPLESYRTSIDYLGKYLTRKYAHWTVPYSTFKIDRWGNLIVTNTYPLSPRHEKKGFNHTVLPEVEKTLKETAEWAKQNHVILVMDGANAILPDRGIEDVRQTMAVNKAMCDRIGLPYLDDVSAHFFPEEGMLDSIHHLNPAGRRVRTEWLAEALRPYVPKAPKAGCASDELFLVAPPWQENHFDLPKSWNGRQYRLLVKVPSPLGQAITAPQALEAAKKGTALYFTDPQIAPILEQEGLRVVEESSYEESLTEFCSHYPHHIFLFANTVGEAPAFLEGSRIGCGCFGSGEYKNPALIHGEKLYYKDCSQKLAMLDLPMTMKLDSCDPENNGLPSIMLNDLYWKTTGPGLLLTVVDPSQGAFIETVFLKGQKLHHWTLYRAGVPK